MADFLQSQIQDSCRLALPNGLKELMSDISREVLRAQPPDMLKFIAQYLSTLLVTRENLYIASKVCGVVYDCQCRPELDDELRYIGLDEQNASDAAEIVEKFIGTGEVNEGNLLLKLVRKTSIDESQLPAVLTAIRRAFLRHQTNHTKIYESSSDSEEDEIQRAARHTLKLYRKTEPSYETYNCMAMKIQASYRAYKVGRESGTIRTVNTDQLSKTPSESESFRSTHEATRSKHSETSSRTENDKTKVTFEALGHLEGSSANDETGTCVGEVAERDKPKQRFIKNRLSSTSLAGSYLSLPQYRPYSAHDFDNHVSLEETPEKECSNFDYTRENSPVEKVYINIENENMQKDKKIMFFESPNDDDYVEEEIIELYEEEEHILECIEEDAGALDIVELAEGVVDEILMEKGLDAKDNAENILKERLTEHDIANEQK